MTDRQVDGGINNIHIPYLKKKMGIITSQVKDGSHGNQIT